MTYRTEDIFIAMVLMTGILIWHQRVANIRNKTVKPSETWTLCLPRGYWAVTFIGDCEQS